MTTPENISAKEWLKNHNEPKMTLENHRHCTQCRKVFFDGINNDYCECCGGDMGIEGGSEGND